MVYTYILIFFMFGFVGWLCEVAYAAVEQKKFVNRGFLNGPICPIYGFGVVLIYLAVKPFTNMAAIVIASMILGTLLELITGFVLEKVFHQKWWDYSNQPHNFRGYVCLRFSIVWGLAGAAIAKIIVPVSEDIINIIPKTFSSVLVYVLLGLMAVDFIVTALSIVGLNRKLKNLEYVILKLKEESALLGESIISQAKEIAGKTVVSEAARLKVKYEEMLKTNRFHSRIIKAFPDLHSIKYNKSLEEVRQNLDSIKRKSSQALKKHNEMAIAVYEEKREKSSNAPFASGLSFSKLFWVFMIGNFVGFLLETMYCLLSPPHQFELRVSVVYGPFILVYGFGAVIMTLLLYKLYNQKDVMIFLASMFIGATFEYTCSLFQQMAFGTVSWEYSGSALSVGGRTNLMYAFFWGILGLVWIKDIYPRMSRLIEKFPKKIGRVLTVAVAIFMVFDMAISSAAVYRQTERHKGIKATNEIQVFLDKHYDDEFLNIIYPNMQYVGDVDILSKVGAKDK